MKNWKKIFIKSCAIFFIIEFLIMIVLNQTPIKDGFLKTSLSSFLIVSISGFILFHFILKYQVVESENKIKQQQKDFKMISSALQFGIWKWDMVSDQVVWDEALYKVFDVTDNDPRSAREIWNEYVHEDSKIMMRKKIEESIALNKDVEFTVKLTTANKNNKYVGVKGFVVRDIANKPIKMYGFIWDKTSNELSKQALELEKLKVLQAAKLSSLGEMSAGIAHEINNPLMIIDSNLSLMSLIKNDSIKMEAKIESARGAVTRIAKIVSGLKKFSRFSDSSKQPILFSSVINESVNLTEIKAQKNGVTVSINNQCEDLYVNGNDLELEQIVVNLINNAIDAVKDKPKDLKWVKINVFTSHNDSKVCCEVIDSGNGIPVQYVQKLYDPFFTTKPVGEGTGLGLSIAKGIIDDHQGELLYDDQCQNTCFKILLNKVS